MKKHKNYNVKNNCFNFVLKATQNWLDSKTQFIFTGSYLAVSLAIKSSS